MLANNLKNDEVIFEVKSKQYSFNPSNLKKKNGIMEIDYQKNAPVGSEITFDKVLRIGDNFGLPYLDGVSIVGKVLSHPKGKKQRIFKYKAKNGYNNEVVHPLYYQIFL